MLRRTINYLQDTKNELSHVSWPTQRQALIYSALVIGISALVALFTGGFDYVFTNVLNIFIR